MADLNELRADLATVEGNLARERPHAEAERCLRALDRDPGVFSGAGARVRVLEKRAHKIEATIVAEEAHMKAREFVGSHDEYVRLGRLERELDATIERALLELASAKRDGAAAVDFKRRYDSPSGFAHLGYTGWDHKTPGPGIMPIPDEIDVNEYLAVNFDATLCR